jgi:hypothetical protein
MASALKKSRIEGNSVSSATSGTFDECFGEKSVAASFDPQKSKPNFYTIFTFKSSHQYLKTIFKPQNIFLINSKN